mgnify:CR=1 FL=1
MSESSSFKKTNLFIRENEKTRPSLDVSRTVARGIFTDRNHPWAAIPHLSNYIKTHGNELSHDEYDEIAENVWVHISAYLAPTAKIEAPAIICGGAKISHLSYVANSVIGSFATVGEMTSVKHSIMFDKSKLCGHNQLSSSVLGYGAVLGIGSMAPDTRLDFASIAYDMPEEICLSGRTHLGAVICDDVKIGASCVINPGTVIDIGCTVYPLTSVSGYVYPYTTVR